MQLTIPPNEIAAAVLFGEDAEFEFFEPGRAISLSPQKLCVLSDEEDLFDED